MKKFLSLILVFVFAVGICASAPITITANAASVADCASFDYSNVGENNYFWNWSDPIYSYLDICSNGDLMRFQVFEDYENLTMFVEYYDSNFNLKSRKTIKNELPLFGGFYSDGNNYYILSGQTNPDENDSVEVFRLTKYDLNWNRNSSVSVNDCNTTIPFVAGTPRFAHLGNQLVVRTDHQMYKSSDGLNHQENVTLVINRETMTIVEKKIDAIWCDWGHCGHSFNQFIKVDNGEFFAVDHGDAYPRSLVLTKCNNGEELSFLDIPGEIGDNYTGCTIGGFEVSNSNYIIAGTKINLNDFENSETKNVFISYIPKNSDTATVKMITSYAEGTSSASTPHFLKLSNNKFMLLWEKDNKTHYLLIDECGNKLSKEYIVNFRLSDCDPVIYNNKIVWYTYDWGQMYFYEIDTSNISKSSSKFLDFTKLKTPKVSIQNTAKGIKVTWNAIENAEKYIVYSSTYSTKNKKWSSWKNRGTVTTTSWTDTTVKSGTKYKYTVKAVNGSVKGEHKSSSSILYLAQPTVKIANNASGVKVSWNKITGATGYTIYRSVYSGGKWSEWNKMGTLKSTKTSWTDKSVKSGVKYKYTVKAVNGKTGSTYKSSSSLLYLAQPESQLKNTSNGIKVSWKKIAGATGYTVYSSTYNAKTKKWSGWSNRGTTTKTSWTDKNVKSGTYYKYTVKATNGKVTSAHNPTGGLICLAQPTVSAKSSSGTVQVSWNKVTGATGYRVYRKANNATKWSTLATVKGTSYNDVKVSEGNSYSYTVKAYKGKVWSSYNTKGVTVSLDSRMQVFYLVNAERKKAGLEPLEYYTQGQKAADIRVKEIVEKFDHERPDGTMCFTVFKEMGVSYYSAGENIAYGQRTPEIVMNAWMNSKGHKANILDPSYTHIIVGYDKNSNSWVQLFLGNPYTE